MNLIFHIFKKDIRRFKWLLALWLLAAAIPVLGGVGDVFFGVKSIETHTFFLNLGFYSSWFQWFLLIAMTAWILQDETPLSDKAFWLTRPISGLDLVLAKGLFIGFLLVLFPLASQTLLLAFQGASAGELGWAALEILLRQLETVSLAALIAVVTKNFGWFVPTTLLAFLLQWIAVNWIVLWRFFDKMTQALLKPVAMMESDATVAALFTILWGFGLVVHQYRTRQTGRTIRGAFAGLVLLILIPLFWRWDFQKPSLPRDPDPSSITLGMGKYSVAKEAWPLSHDHRQFLSYFGHLEPSGGSPGDVFLPTRFKYTLTLSGGRVLKDDGYGLFWAPIWVNLTSQWATLPTSNGGTVSSLWRGSPFVEGIQNALGKVKIINPDLGGRLDLDFLRMEEDYYRKDCGQPASYHADVDLVRYRYKVEAEIPLVPNAGYKDGAYSVTVMEALPQNPGFQVKLQSQCLSLDFGNDLKTRKLLYYAEDNVFYVLENKKLGEAFLAEPLYGYLPMDLFQEKLPLRVEREILDFRTNEFDPAQKGHLLDHVWLKDAVLVRLRMIPVGESVRPLDVASLRLVGNGGKSLQTRPVVYVGQGLGIPTIQAYPTPAAKPETVVEGKKLTAPGKTLLVDDFENGGNRNKLGGYWSSDMDYSKLGTVLSPMPFKPEPGGCPASPHYAAHIGGHLGKEQAPWVWALIGSDFTFPKKPVDLSGFSALRFWEKGDGKPYEMILTRASIKDAGNYRCSFHSTRDWTQVTIPFSDLYQPHWAKPVDPGLKDVESLQFNNDVTTTDDEDFDLWIDQIELVK